MSSPDRFHHVEIGAAAVGGVVVLDDAEGRHATRAKRHRPGDTVELFDGAGRVARATVVSADPRRGVAVEVVAIEDHPRSRRVLHVGCAVPRGDRMETLLDMATQLGATRFTPLEFEHSVRLGGAGRRERWSRVVVEAAKQSRRVFLPAIDEPVGFDTWLQDTDAARVGAAWLADPAGRDAREAVTSLGDRLTVTVGPEGGLTGAERRAALAAGFEAVSLGASILRIETAVAAFATLAAVGGGDR